MAAKKTLSPVSKPEKTWLRLFATYKWDLLILALSFSIYINSLPNGYNMDDELVTRNHSLTAKGFAAIPEIFTSSYYKDQSGYAYEYRPLVLSSFAIEHQLFGESPYISHFINVILYSICCMILLRLLLVLLGPESLLLALVITLLFVVHPAHTEVICSIKNRDDILALIFALLSMKTALKAAASGKKWLFMVSPFIFGLSLLSKISAVSFAFLIPLTLILFTETSYLIIVFTGFLFVSLTMLFVNNIFNLYQKIILLLEILAILTVIYAIYKRINFLPRIKSIFQTVFPLANKPGNAQQANLDNSAKVSGTYSFTIISCSIFLLASLIIATYLFNLDKRFLSLAALWAAMTVLYGVCNAKLLYTSLGALLKTGPRLFHMSLAHVQSIFSNIRAGFNGQQFYPALIAFAAGLISLYGLFSDHSSLLIIALLILFLLSAFGKKSFAYWASIALNLCLVVAIQRYHFTNESVYGALLFVMLAYQIIFGPRQLAVPAAFLLIFSIYLTFSFSISPKDLAGCLGVYAILIPLHIIFPVSGFGYRFKWFLGLITVLLSIVLVASFYYAVRNVSNSLNIDSHVFGYIPSLLALIVIFFRLNPKKLVAACKLGAVLLLLFTIKTNPLKDVLSVHQQIKTSITDYGSATNNPVLPAEQDRPLLYLEQPVTARDPWQIRLGTSFEILFQYLHKVVLPYPMAFYYGYKFVKPQKITEPVPFLSLAIYLALSLISVIIIRWDKMLSFGLIIYLISIAAVSNYFMPVPGQLGERFLLTPSIGWAIFLGALLFRLFKVNTGLSPNKWREVPSVAKYIFSGVMIFYCGITFARNFNWKDDLTLFRHDISYVNQSAQAHNLLALHLMQKSTTITDPTERQQYWQEALTHFKRSYQIYPGFYNVSFDLGRVFSMLNMPDSSVFYFQNAINIDSTNSDAYLNAGSILIGERKYLEAKPYFECLVRRHPERYNGYENLSFIYYNLGDYQASLKVNKTIAQRLPSLPDPLINIAQTYLTLNNADSAYFYVQKALQIDPNNPRANRLLGNFKITKH